jgi:hypothetical protein
MSERSQRVLVWWGVIFAIIYGVAFVLLLHMVPPPSAKLPAVEIAAWYAQRHDSVRIGDVIASWTGAFLVPITVVIAIQMARQEAGPKIWSLLTVCGGAMMSIFLVLPPLFWGVAAFTPARAPEVTALMHELGMLTLVTTDQYYIFMWVAIAVISLRSTTIANSPFPRWYGYFTIWTALMFEAGAIAFLARTGPFAWNGLPVFWSPLVLFGAWIGVTAYLLLKVIREQREAGQLQRNEAEYELAAIA